MDARNTIEIGKDVKISMTHNVKRWPPLQNKPRHMLLNFDDPLGTVI